MLRSELGTQIKQYLHRPRCCAQRWRESPLWTLSTELRGNGRHHPRWTPGAWSSMPPAPRSRGGPSSTQTKAVWPPATPSPSTHTVPPPWASSPVSSAPGYTLAVSSLDSIKHFSQLILVKVTRAGAGARQMAPTLEWKTGTPLPGASAQPRRHPHQPGSRPGY